MAHPTDSRQLERSREQLVKAAGQAEITLRQNYNRDAPRLVQQVGRYAHARQFKRMNRVLRTLRSRVGQVTCKRLPNTPLTVSPMRWAPTDAAPCLYDIRTGQRGSGVDSQAFARVVIDDSEGTEFMPIEKRVRNKIHTPALVRAGQHRAVESMGVNAGLKLTHFPAFRPE